jgi:hypothetical protein
MASRLAACAAASIGTLRSATNAKHKAVTGRRSIDMDASVGSTGAENSGESMMRLNMADATHWTRMNNG